METGIELIAKERIEQIEKHGRTIKLDVEQNDAYQLSEGAQKLIWPHHETYLPKGWDKYLWQKMCQKGYKDRLIIAGALIAAEIDRLNYTPEP